MKWKFIKPAFEPQVVSLSKALATLEPFPLPLAEVLIQREILTYEAAKDFFSPSIEKLHSPWLFKGMDIAVERIAKAMENKEKILIYGDYDVDGTTAIAILKLFFEEIGYPVDCYVPNRFSEGYGLSFQGIEKACISGVTLMIVLDCGTKELEKCKFAGLKGIDLIICDHHTPGTELPACVSFLNPRQAGCEYPFKDLSAGGIAMKLAMALNDRLKKGIDVFEKWGDLVLLSIACDLVPLKDENRILAWHGLQKLRENPLPGIRALKKLSGTEKSWTIEDVVFFLGPRINSAGRKGNAIHAVELLLGNQDVVEEVASGLQESNEWRKEVDSFVTGEALAMIESNPIEMNRNSTVLFHEGWNKGVIGIVASRLIEKYYRPTVILTRSEDVWVGSARSVIGFDLYEAMNECKDCMLQFGGHKYAAGLTLKESQLLEFKSKFEEVVSRKILPEHKEPCIEIAAEADFSYLNEKFVRLMQRLGPFGPENPEPVFVSRNVSVTEARVLQGSHLKLSLDQNGKRVEAIGFNLAEKWNKQPAKKIDLAWQAGFNTWNGWKSIQLKIKDFDNID